MGVPQGEDRDERMAVLRMLEEGKITAAEATELLRALRAPAPPGQASGQEGAGGWDRGFRPEGAPPGFAFRGVDARRIERAARHAALRAQRAAEYWSQHAEELAERVGRAAEQVVGENIGRVLATLPDMVERAARAGWGRWGPGYRFDDVEEGEVGTDGEGVLDIEAWNGSVTVRPVDGGRARLVLHKTVHAPDDDEARRVAAAVVAAVEGRALRVRRRPGAPAWPGGLSVEAFVPRGLLWSGELRGGNGGVDVEGLRLRGLKIETSNGGVRVEACEGDDLAAATSNGRIDVAGRIGGTLRLQTSNGAIELAPDVPAGETRVEARTSNGHIQVRLPAGVAVDLAASTSNGRFDLSGLGPDGPDLGSQKGWGRSEVRWRTPAWAEAPARLYLDLRTSNGGVRVL